ncbi:fluoroquinolone export ABC transporter permease subunit [Paenibacillus lautus]|uniref:fluoroquinolone export ABC transporter permease subunit n=1 Tax=Paenibacillus lautus TaxID=1401 RepID=UPI000BBD5397|nr:ABC transporter permease [Paenibacillus lautus]PCL92928.1 ABC transporter permease [Paenibacillus lautus]
MKGLSLFVFDLRFQWRHGFYWVYAFVCTCYWILLRFVPEAYQETTAIVLTFSDPAALGLIMAGGMVLLERDQGVHDPLFVSPVHIRDYLLAKAASLSVLSLAAGWVIHMATGSLPKYPLAFSAGIVLTSSFMTLLSIGVAARQRTINGFILMVQAYGLPFVLPLLGFLQSWEAGLFFALPTEGTLRLLVSPSGGLSMGSVLYSVTILLIWNVAVYLWAHHSYSRHVLMRIGEGGAKNVQI